MEENVNRETGDSLRRSDEQYFGAPNFRFECPHDGNGGIHDSVVGISNADDSRNSESATKSDSMGLYASVSNVSKYKLLSPAKLPISRSPCFTIPPGLSPSSFLDSPVLLSNMKVRIACNFTTFALYLVAGYTQVSIKSHFFFWSSVKWKLSRTEPISCYNQLTEGFFIYWIQPMFIKFFIFIFSRFFCSETKFTFCWLDVTKRRNHDKSANGINSQFVFFFYWIF